MILTEMTIPSVSNNGVDASFFSEKKIKLNGDELRTLSDRQDCLNFRLRSSGGDYRSDFHVAGDPTLLIILEGSLKISLRSGEARVFSAGQMFIAEDYLIDAQSFDNNIHGHKAEVVGGEPLSALHLKLSAR